MIIFISGGTIWPERRAELNSLKIKKKKNYFCVFARPSGSVFSRLPPSTLRNGSQDEFQLTTYEFCTMSIKL